MSRNIVNAGTTRKTFIDVKGGERLDFEYRLMTSGRCEQYLAADSAATGAQKAKVAAKVISQQLVSWSEVDKEGAPLKTTPENVEGLPHPVLQRMVNILMGFGTGDADPDVRGGETADDLLALAEGKNVVAEKRDDQEGNSAAG